MTASSEPLWEQPVLRTAAGETLRPGSFALTDRAAELVGLVPGCKVLDVGSGLGATVNRLRARYGAEAFGIEQSARQLERASDRSNPVQATGSALPFADGTFDAAIGECVLSLLPAPEAGLAESPRVTMAGGFLLLSDMFAGSEGRVSAPAPGAARTAVVRSARMSAIIS